MTAPDGSPAPRLPRLRRIGTWFARTGWVHLILLSGAGLFLFPFLWMMSTSLKTDEEIPDQAIIPEVPTFRAASPFVRPPPEIRRPAGATAAWDADVERFVRRARVAARDAAPPPLASRVDREALLDNVARRLVLSASQAVPTDTLKTGNADAIEAALVALFTPARIAAAFDDQIGRLELRRVQVRTLDARVYTVATPADIASRFRVVSGPGQIALVGGTPVLSYQFADTATPIVLEYTFDFPTPPDRWHKLLFTIRGDDSWHGIRAEFDLGGRRYQSERASPIAQHRAASLLFQPRTFEDDTYKSKTWVTMLDSGPAPVATGGASTATLRITIEPAGTPQAIYAKATRNYSRAFLAVPFWTYVFNSVVLVALTVVGVMFSSSFVAYAFARLNWPGRSAAMLLLLSTMMLPSQVTMIPQFMIWRSLGWYNTLNPLWVPAWFGSAFFIFLMVQHMKTIPRELEEAARIDGLNAVQTWWYIIVPQTKPTLAATAIMVFMGAWNEFMGPLIYLRDQSRFPLSLGLFGARIDQGGDWPMIMAGNMIMTVPVIVIFFIFQRYFIQGMTMSGMKG